MLKIDDQIPDSSGDVLAQALARAVRDRSLPGGLSDRVEPGKLTAVAPHPVYALRLDRLEVQFNPAADAVFSGWRFLLAVGQDVVAQAELRPAGTGPPQFAGVAVGSLAKTTAAAIELADAQLATSGDYVLAALDIPGLPARLLWLRNTAGPAADVDKWIPVLACPPTVATDHVHDRGEVEKLLVEAAKAIVVALPQQPVVEN